MNVIVCVDNRFGMLFNNRRVSRDKVRKKRAEKSIKADAHTMDDVFEYVVNELGYIEVDKSEVRYKEEYREMRKKVAENISIDLFDIDLHIFAQTTNNLESCFSIEKNYGLISSSSSGSKSETKKFEKQFRKVYMYYGVTQNDIDEHTKRYEELVRVLAQ